MHKGRFHFLYKFTVYQRPETWYYGLGFLYPLKGGEKVSRNRNSDQDEIKNILSDFFCVALIAIELIVTIILIGG